MLKGIDASRGWQIQVLILKALLLTTLCLATLLTQSALANDPPITGGDSPPAATEAPVSVAQPPEVSAPVPIQVNAISEPAAPASGGEELNPPQSSSGGGAQTTIAAESAGQYTAGVPQNPDESQNADISATSGSTADCNSSTDATNQQCNSDSQPQVSNNDAKSVHEASEKVSAQSTDIILYIQILATDENGVPLKGAEFTLYHSMGFAIETLVTGDDGLVIFRGLESGTYVVKETKEPRGYSGQYEQSFFIDCCAPPGSGIAVHKKCPNIVIIKKTDESGQPMPGVDFTVYDKYGNIIYKNKTNDDGEFIIFSDFAVGSYRIMETWLNDEYWTDFIGRDFDYPYFGEPIKVVNYRCTGSITIHKVDQYGKALSGIGFKITQGAKSYNGTTNSEGLIEFSGLAPGFWTIEEIDIPACVDVSYDPSSSMEVKCDQNIYVTVINSTRLGSIHGVVFEDANRNKKQDQAEKGLANVAVELSWIGLDEQTFNRMTRTDNEGKYGFDDLYPGSYTVTETDPNGFKSSTENILTIALDCGGEMPADFGDYREESPPPSPPPGGGTHDLSITKSVDKETAAPGEILTYVLAYKNTGESPLEDVQIGDNVPAGASYVVGSASDGGLLSIDGNTLVWNIGNLEVGAGGSVTFKVQINADAQGTIDNCGIIRARHVPEKSAFANTAVKAVVLSAAGEPVVSQVEAQGLPEELPYTGLNMILFLIHSLLLLVLGSFLLRKSQRHS